MPRVSAFYGITISFYWADHPPAHFHAEHGEHEAVIELRTLRVLSGRLPGRKLGLVRTWASLHEEELAANWKRARCGRDLERIEPLR